MGKSKSSSSSSSSSSSDHGEHKPDPEPTPQQGPVSAEHSTVSPKTDSLERYEGAKFETHLIDDTLHQPKTQSTASVKLVDSDGNAVEDFDLQTSGGEGVFFTSFIGNRSGEFTVIVHGDDVEIAKWTVTVKQAPVDPETSSVTPKEENLDRYQKTSFDIVLNDSKSNPVFHSTPSVDIESAFGLSLSSEGNKHVATYTAELDGTFPISVTVGDLKLADWDVHVKKAPVDPATSSVDPRETPRDIGQETSFHVTLNDSHSNPVLGVDPSVESGFSVSQTGAEGHKYSFSYTPTEAGDFKVTVKAGDVEVGSWDVNVPAPPPPPPAEEKKKSKSSSSSSSSSSSD